MNDLSFTLDRGGGEKCRKLSDSQLDQMLNVVPASAAFGVVRVLFNRAAFGGCLTVLRLCASLHV